MARGPLTDAEAIQVWLMHWEGKLQHEIAAAFGKNQGRISEVLNGKTHLRSRADALSLRPNESGEAA